MFSQDVSEKRLNLLVIVMSLGIGLGVTVTYVFSVSVLVTVRLVQPSWARAKPIRGMTEKIADFIFVQGVLRIVWPGRV